MEMKDDKRRQQIYKIKSTILNYPDSGNKHWVGRVYALSTLVAVSSAAVAGQRRRRVCRTREARTLAEKRAPFTN